MGTWVLINAPWYHNARYQQDSAKRRIRYAFHPRFGEEIIVVGRQRYCGEPAYVGREPDDSLALVPVWMTEESTAAMALVDVPRFPLSCLRDLRREIDDCLKLLRDDSRRGGGNHGAKATAQPATTRPVSSDDTSTGASGRSAATPSALIGALLREAAGQAKEADHEDHA